MKNFPKNPEHTFRMYELISGYWVACSIHVAARLQIADLLANGPESVAELARKSKTHETSLYRLLRALASVGVFEEQPGRVFSLNDLGATLLSDTPGSIRPWALANLGEHFPAFGNMTHGIQTGEIPFDHVYNKSLWDYYKENPDASDNFVKAMAGVSGAVLKGIVMSYDFTPYKTIVDIGGGNGTLMFSVLNAAPASKGIIFDEAYVVDDTSKQIPEDLKGRCSVAAGSFFEEIPAGADLYMTKWVIHDWNDEEAITLLKVCRKAMRKDSKLIIIDSVIPDELNKPHAGKLLDLNIFTLTPGKERTQSEYQNILNAAGLKLKRVIQTNTEISSITECEVAD